MDPDETPTMEEKPFIRTDRVGQQSPSTNSEDTQRPSTESPGLIPAPPEVQISSSSDSDSSEEDPEQNASFQRNAGGKSNDNDEDSMSNSYHEIFDTQMPPEKAKVIRKTFLSIMIFF